jgi:hypothetical protein
MPRERNSALDTPDAFQSAHEDEGQDKGLGSHPCDTHIYSFSVPLHRVAARGIENKLRLDGVWVKNIARYLTTYANLAASQDRRCWRREPPITPWPRRVVVPAAALRSVGASSFLLLQRRRTPRRRHRQGMYAHSPPPPSGIDRSHAPPTPQLGACFNLHFLHRFSHVSSWLTLACS